MTSSDTTEVTTDLGSELRRVLAPDAVAAVLQSDVLADADAAMAQRVAGRAEQVRQSILGQAADIPVEDELHWTLALSYMELKSQWLQRQVRVCYEEMMTGSCDRETATEASMMSAFISIIEPLLNDEHRARIDELFVTQTA